jgi:prevent-host-death family protein
MQKITLAQASQNLPYLVEAALSGDVIIITENNQPVAKLISVESRPIKFRPKFGSAKGIVTISDESEEIPDDLYEHKDEQTVTNLLPIKPRPKFGSAKGIVTISDDFDEPLEEFKEYME